MKAPGIDATHDPKLKSWVASAECHAEFPIQNLPYGIFSTASRTARAGTAIGERILDLQAAAGLLPQAVRPALQGGTLNELFALPAADRQALRHSLARLLSDESNRATVEPMLVRAADASMHMPAAIGGYTDFYVGIHHATNVGRLFRPDSPLMPNYKHVPVGYHGRASSICPSGVPVVRPNGQERDPQEELPRFGPTRRLDYELELGVWIGEGNPLGTMIPIKDAPRHIAGFCLLNDWSARDLQAWEYQPLGPFVAKNFHTTISPWVVTAEAMAPFRLPQPARPPGDPRPLPYLCDEADQKWGALAVMLEVSLQTQSMRASGLMPHLLSRGPASNMYWTAAQIVAHHASNGCNLEPGDLLGTGTISAPTEDGFGSLLELTRGGTEPIRLPNGETRAFLQDDDEIILAAHGSAAGFIPIGFGACRALVLPAQSPD